MRTRRQAWDAPSDKTLRKLPSPEPLIPTGSYYHEITSNQETADDDKTELLIPSRYLEIAKLPVVTIRQDQLVWRFSSWDVTRDENTLYIFLKILKTKATAIRTSGTIPALVKDEYVPTGYTVNFNSGERPTLEFQYSNEQPSAGDRTSELTIECVVPAEYEPVICKIVITGVNAVEAFEHTFT